MVVNSMFRSIPTIANVLILLVMFWMVFGILGLQLFGGKFYSCNDGAMGSAQECAGMCALTFDYAQIHATYPCLFTRRYFLGRLCG